MKSHNQAYTNEQLQSYIKKIHEEIRFSGLPKSYASGLPYHEAKKIYIKEIIEQWKKNRINLYNNQHRQILIENQRIKAEEKAKKEAESQKVLIEEKHEKQKSISVPQEVNNSPPTPEAENTQAEQQHLTLTEENLKIQGIYKIKHSINNLIVKYSEDKEIQEKEVSINDDFLGNSPLPQERELISTQPLFSEQIPTTSLNDDLIPNVESKSEYIPDVVSPFSIYDEKIFEEPELLFSYSPPQTPDYNIPSSTSLEPTKKTEDKNFHEKEILKKKRQEELDNGLFNLETYGDLSFSDRDLIQKLSETYNSFQKTEHQTSPLYFNSVVSQSMRHLDKIYLQFNMYEPEQSQIHKLKPFFSDIKFSNSFNKDEVIVNHQLVFQDIITLSLDIVQRKKFQNFKEIVLSSLSSIHEKSGVYLLFLHYQNAVLIKNMPKANIKKISASNIEDLIFQTSCVFNELSLLKNQCENSLQFIDKKEINVQLFKEIIVSISKTISTFMDIYRNFVLNNHLFFFLKEKEDCSQFSLYLSSHPPELNQIIESQVREIK